MRAMGPLSRSRLLNMVRAVEYELQETRGGVTRGSQGKAGFGSSSQYRSNSYYPSGRNSNSDWVVVRKGKEGGEGGNSGSKSEEKKSGGFKDRGVRHLPYNELLGRRKKGLCFKCGGPFHGRHQCPDKQLRLMIIDDDEEAKGEAHVMAGCEEEEFEAVGECNMMGILSLLEDTKWQPQTMKVRGLVRGVAILILVDSGATHNFISRKLVAAMGWPTEDTTPMLVSQGQCAGLQIEVGSVSVEVNALLFDLEGIDVVLGISWLATVGEMRIDWKKQVMSFQLGEKWVEIRGANAQNVTQVALQSFITRPRRLINGLLMSGDIQAAVPEGELKECRRNSEVQQKELSALLMRYDEVFKEPQGLPPKRKKEHAIVLAEGQGLVNVRPYRYPHHQKNEIEKQVKEMLQSGIIRHSQSAYSSPVILVKKKDATWRMCVDYRALNKATIPDL